MGSYFPYDIPGRQNEMLGTYTTSLLYEYSYIFAAVIL